ncbi:MULTISPECIES: helix-turn-helix domain-containing protein [unclassified Bradyrhizobium]|uniref:helix-turn-helix domain-containing protein n=1 Tax=unclassified Bradyrhizobium TaxID=2631580 RepID=UPI003399C6E9
MKMNPESGRVIARQYRDLRFGVDEAEFVQFLEKAGGAIQAGRAERWLTRDQAAQLLGIDETTVWGLGKNGFLPKREGQVAMFSRADVERVAQRCVFGPEMIRRSVFNQKAQLNRWLKSVGVLPVTSLRDGKGKVYDRAEFEGALHLQPEPLEEVAPEKRQNHRLSQKDKEEAVAAVRSGLTPDHVAKRMGVYHSTVAKWVKELEATGRIRPGGKLEPYANRIAEMIKAGPLRSTYALHAEFMKREQMKVAYTRFSRFIVDLGFVRDPQTRCLQREDPYRTVDQT